MYIKVKFDEDFEDLIMHLRSKYGHEIFDMDGIGKQLDMATFGKQFFSESTKAVSKISVDANSNVDDVSVVAYENEVPKPYMRLNSLYLLWKSCRKYYGTETANKIVEGQIIGDFYINDLSNVQKPYSYHKDTMIFIKHDNKINSLNMEDLFYMFKDKVQILSDREEINLNDENIYIYDEHDNFVKLKYILRHKNTQGLLKLETKNGNTTIVTNDHPVILKDGSEKQARDLTLDDEIKTTNIIKNIPLGNENNIDYGYFLGFFVGDGYLEPKVKGRFINSKEYEKNKCIDLNTITSGSVVLCQKDIENSKIYEVSSRILKDIKIRDNRKLYSNDLSLVRELMKTGLGSKNRKLPNDILKYDKETLKSVISGVIDSEGTINCKNGIITIRITSFTLAQQIADILRILDCGKVRCSIVNKYQQSKNSYKNNYDLYRISIRLEDIDFIKYSEKIRDNSELVFKPMKKDGRFDSSKLNKIMPYSENQELVYDITTETGHFYCQGMIQHNCYNFSCYDVMTKGLPFVKKVKSEAPKHLSSFTGQLIHFTSYASNQVMGAVGLADLLIVMSYYVKKELENTPQEVHSYVWRQVKQEIQSLIYSMNQPFRGGLQSGFYNVSIYDKYFLESMKNDYIFPDGSNPDIELVQKIQDLFIDLMNETLEVTTPTFPVTTACFCVDNAKNILDKDFLEYISKKNQKFAFINIYAGTTGTLSSCCRLRSDKTNQYIGYTNSIGGAGTQIGSFGVVTLNLPRLAIKSNNNLDTFYKLLGDLVETSIKINHAKRDILIKRINLHALPLYDYGFMSMQKQYATTGLNGINEAIELLGEDILKEKGQEICSKILEIVNKTNDTYDAKYGYAHNCEQTPSENSAIKIAQKDKLLKYQNKYELYSNQFIPLITQADMLDRIRLQGMFDSQFSGGAIMHINCEEQITDYKLISNLIENVVKQGVVYHAINYNLQKCKEGHMSVGKKDICPICGNPITDNYIRVVGFLVNTKNIAPTRQEFDYNKRQFYKGI